MKQSKICNNHNYLSAFASLINKNSLICGYDIDPLKDFEQIIMNIYPKGPSDSSQKKYAGLGQLQDQHFVNYAINETKRPLVREIIKKEVFRMSGTNKTISKEFQAEQDDVQYDKAVDDESIRQAREQARRYYDTWRYDMPQYFEVYQGMDEKLKKKVFADMQACERFVKRDKDTKEEVRTWVKQSNRHIDYLNRHALQEKKYVNDKIIQAIIRRKQLQATRQSWKEAEQQRLQALRIAQAKKKRTVFSKFTTAIAAFSQRKSDKAITTNEQQEILIKTSKKT